MPKKKRRRSYRGSSSEHANAAEELSRRAAFDFDEAKASMKMRPKLPYTSTTKKIPARITITHPVNKMALAPSTGGAFEACVLVGISPHDARRKGGRGKEWCGRGKNPRTALADAFSNAAWTLKTLRRGVFAGRRKKR